MDNIVVTKEWLETQAGYWSKVYGKTNTDRMYAAAFRELIARREGEVPSAEGWTTDGGQAVNEPEFCCWCTGTGKSQNGGACYQCNGTGRVWPEVEGEIVVDPASLIMIDVTLRNGSKQRHAVHGVPGHRIIVQPIPAQPEKEGSDG